MAGRRVLVVNLVLYQAGWFACVLGAAHGLPWAGALAAAAIVAVHLALAARPAPELGLIALAALAGLVFESALAASGWIRFEQGVLLEGTAPYWMVALWAVFATTLNVSLRALREHPGWTALLGAVGAPLAYLAGARLGAMELVATSAALVAIGLGWALLAPLLMRAARRLDGFAPA